MRYLGGEMHFGSLWGDLKRIAKITTYELQPPIDLVRVWETTGMLLAIIKGSNW